MHIVFESNDPLPDRSLSCFSLYVNCVAVPQDVNVYLSKQIFQDCLVYCLGELS